MTQLNIPRSGAEIVDPKTGRFTDFGYRFFIQLIDILNAASGDVSGAVMKSEYTASSVLVAASAGDPQPLQLDASRILGRKATGDITSLQASDVLTILGLTVGERDQIANIDGTVIAAATWAFIATLAQGTAVADSGQSWPTVTSTGAGGTYTSAEQTLINELKADVNTLSTATAAVETKLNNLLAQLRSSKIIAT